jgi:hypothetical protein
MRFEIENGSYVGTAEWQGPGSVSLDMEDPKQRGFFERYFEEEHSALGGSVDCPELQTERADTSEQSFERAMNSLAAYAYKIRRADSSRTARPRRDKQRSDA